MSKQEITIQAEERTEKGSSAAGRLRRAGFTPAALNRIGGGTLLLKLNGHDFEALLKRHGDEQLLLSLVIGGKPVPAIMREVQRHVLTEKPVHADFGEIDLTAKIRVQIPVRLVGEPVGVKMENGILQQTARHIEVECLPADVVEEFTVDVSALKLGESLFARQIPLDERYTLVIGKERVAVATVAAPEEEEKPAEGEAAEGAAEPEVIAKGKKEEAAEGEAKDAGAKKDAGSKKK